MRLFRPDGRRGQFPDQRIWWGAEAAMESSAKRLELDATLELLADAVDFMVMNVRPDLSQDPLAEAVRRLDGAMSRIERVTTRLQARVSRAEAALSDGVDADIDRARLAEALDLAKSREDELADAAQQAAEVLDAAIDELRAHVSVE